MTNSRQWTIDVQPFLIVGQPRSGTTYLQTLLNTHPQVHCRGEVFDPWQIDDNGQKTQGIDAVIARDANPCDFLDRMLSGDGMPPCGGLRMLGVKLLFQHHPAILARFIPDRPSLPLIHVRRENKLAQFASLQQVEKSGRWTSTTKAPAPTFAPAPFWAASECNRLQNEDFLLASWLDRLPNPVLTLTYHRMFAPDFSATVQGFLGVDPHAGLSSPLVKQGQNRILDRFSNPQQIAQYFRGVGLGHWLDAEL